MTPAFKTIDLASDFDTCFAFRKDSYFVSFGTYDGFEVDMSNYKERMAERISYLPHGNCHLWHEGEIIGQTEMKFVDDADIGYVSLLYLKPEFRNQGLGKLLQQRAVEVFSTLGKKSIQLSVSCTNLPALAFYTKHGWENIGARPDKDNVYLMRFPLTKG